MDPLTLLIIGVVAIVVVVIILIQTVGRLLRKVDSTAGWAGHYGKLVVIDHANGVQTYYAHLSQFLVVTGQEVRRGQVIALSGSTGRATGPHMHYEVRLAGTPVNPYKYLARSSPTQTARSTHSSDLGL